jgi:C-terminal peptidase prc
VFGLSDEMKEDDQLPPGRVFFLGSILTEPLVKDGVSAFTHVTVKGLKGDADKEGYEPDGMVTVDEYITYLEKEFPNVAREVGKTRQEKEQFPLIRGTRNSHFPLTNNPAAAGKVQERLAKLVLLEKDGKVTKEVAAEGRRLLSRMPKLKTQQGLRQDYQQLVDGTLKVEDFLAKRQQVLDGMKLDPKTAAVFAKKSFDGVDVLRRFYIKEISAGEMIANGIRGMYRRLEEPLPADLGDKLKGAKDAGRTTLAAMLEDARMRLGKREDLDGVKDVDLLLAMGIGSLNDDYTEYTDKETVTKREAAYKGNFSGIGAQIRRDAVRDGILVVSPIKGSPAYKAGIRTGDLITEIRRETNSEGKPLAAGEPSTFSTKGMKVEEAVSIILGKPGTKVTVVIEREGEDKPVEYNITRARVAVETALGWKRLDDDSWDYYVDPDSKIAYIHLTQFAPNSFEDIRAAIKKLEKTGIKGLVLDLRFNPGGLLQSAVNISDLFIDDGLIVSIRPRVGSEANYGGEHEGSLTNFPMVCLVNGGSASGSEIVSACLQDHRRAIVMGERSYGKGSVQNIQDFDPTGGQIKLTTATFWRPNGKNLNKSSIDGYQKMKPEELDPKDWGVRPNQGYELKLTRQEREDLFEHMRNREIIPNRKAPPKEEKVFKDKQLDQALEYLRGQIKSSAQANPMKKAG